MENINSVVVIADILSMKQPPNTLSLGMAPWCFTTLCTSCVIKQRLRGSCVATSPKVIMWKIHLYTPNGFRVMGD